MNPLTREQHAFHSKLMPDGSITGIRKIFVCSALLMLAFAVLIFCVNGIRERILVLDAAEKHTASYANALKEHAERVLAEADNGLFHLISHIEENGGISYVHDARFQRLLKFVAAGGPQFSSVFVVDSKGLIIAHSQGNLAQPVNLSDRDYFLHHKNGRGTQLFISKPFTSRVSGTSRFSITRPLRGKDGSFAGLVAVTYEMNYFQRFYKSIDLEKSGRIILATQDGELLINEPAFAGTFAGDFKSSPLFREFLPSAPSGTRHALSPVTGDLRIVSYASLRDFPVVAVVSFSKDEILASWKSSVLKQGMLVALLTSLLGALSLLFLRQLGKLERAKLLLDAQQEEINLANTSIEKVLDPVYWIDRDARIIKVNEAACRSLGYTDEEMHSLTIPELDPLMRPEMWPNHWQELRESGSLKFETRHRRKDGRLIDVEVVANLINFAGQELNCSIVRDITERNEIDRRLAATAKEWQDTFGAVEDAVWLLDMDRRIVRANRGTEAIFGRSADEVVGMRCCDIAHDDNDSRQECPFERMLATKKRAAIQIQMEKRWFEVCADPVFNDSGDIVSGVHVVKEITEIKRAENRERIRSEILERIARSEPLADLLSFLAVSIEGESPGALCSILLASSDKRRLLVGAAPSLPDAYNSSVNRTRVGEGIGSCGTAAYRLERVIVEDIATHPYWTGFKPAEEAGLRSCWSEPIISSGRSLLGTFAIYHREPSFPGTEEIRLIEQASAFASIAIERTRNEAERMELEEQLHQSQKMEAIGHLAGGMAHDFNNLLTPIMIYADMLNNMAPKNNEKLRSKTEGIMRAAGKARDLTRQLLSFGRKQPMQMKAVDINEVLSGMHSMLRRTLNDSIELRLKLSSQPQVITADSSKLEQIVLNLAINAQDAMKSGGIIDVETGAVLVDDEYARRHPDMNQGAHVLMTFSDNGCGMSESTLAHIFEPFYTTKEAGHGTGLGLASVYGIVKQHSGHIEVQSTPGRGTVFRIFFPASDEQPEPWELTGDVHTRDHSGSGSILLVEDNEMVREMALDLLVSFGYAVHAEERPDLALENAARSSERIDLLITDIVMPGMNGREFYLKLREIRPDMGKVLYMSGYSDISGADEWDMGSNENFLQKPFTVDSFMTKVREMMQENS